MLAGNEKEDDSLFDIATVIDPTAVDSVRSQIPEESGTTPHRPTSRAVLMSQGVPVGRLNPSPPSEDVEDSDFDRGGNSELEDGEDEEEDPLLEVVVPTPAELARVAIDSMFRSLDSVTLETEFRTRSCLMRVVPKMMRGVFRTALRLSFQEAAQARAQGDVERETRAWKLFLLAPRLLLTRPPRGGKVSKAKLVERCAVFARGECLALIKTCRADAESGNAATSRRRRRDTGDDLSKRAKKALQLVQWGELSTARQALEGVAVARGSERSLAQLTDPVRRPELPREPIARELMEHNLHEQVELCGEVMLKNPSSSRRGAAARPSGMTGEHLR